MKRWGSAYFILPLAVFLVAQTPSVSENGVLNAASFATAGEPGFAVAPGSLVSIFGTELAADLSASDTIPLSTSLAGVRVSFGGIDAPILFVSPNQINAQLPGQVLAPNVESGTTSVVVNRNGVASAPRDVLVARFSPGFFAISVNGRPLVVAVNNADGSVAQPTGSLQGINTRPARAGEALILYANGLGPVDIPVADGAPSSETLRSTTTVPAVLIGGVEAQVLFSGLTPQFPGVNQVNVLIPQGVPVGNEVPIQLRTAGITSTDRATIAIGN